MSTHVARASCFTSNNTHQNFFMSKRIIRFGVIGCGLMGREFASAAARWNHLLELDFEPRLLAACDPNPQAVAWFQQNCTHLKTATSDYKTLLDDPEIEAIYCAVPHHLHAEIYADIIGAGKHLLGEKPFGIDAQANRAINEAAREHPDVLVRCSSEFPFFPGAQRVFQMARDGKMGRIIEIEAGFWHGSDLDPRKPINWKRRIATNGAYGCMGDLGMHTLHLPLRLGVQVLDVRALLSKIVDQRPDANGQMTPCETWDNAILACRGRRANDDDSHQNSGASKSVSGSEIAATNAMEASHGPHMSTHGAPEFPLLISTKRIAPGHGNTWFVRIIGTQMSAEFSTKNPKQLRFLPYAPGDEQAWREVDCSSQSVYATITGSIFEFGFSDSILQMWAAFCDELVNRDAMKGDFKCVTIEEAAQSHALFSAALQSQESGETVRLEKSNASAR